jgi:hypothetical protein
MFERIADGVADNCRFVGVSPFAAILIVSPNLFALFDTVHCCSERCGQNSADRSDHQQGGDGFRSNCAWRKMMPTPGRFRLH